MDYGLVRAMQIPNSNSSCRRRQCPKVSQSDVGGTTRLTVLIFKETLCGQDRAKQFIVPAEIDEADISKMDKHVVRPESIEFGTRSQVTVEAFNCAAID